MTIEPKPFCDARQADEPAALRCDLPEGHDGDRHEETWVATWLRDGTAVLWCYNVASPLGSKPRYRYDPRMDAAVLGAASGR